MHTLPYHFGDDDDEWSPSEGGDGGEAVMEAKRRSHGPCFIYVGLCLSMFIYVVSI
jgi:hypothetical protein